MMKPDPFHEGERYVQERTGEREGALRNGVMVGSAIPSRAIPFLAEQRMLAIGSVDDHGAVWASVLFGGRGLASSSDGRSLVIDRTRIDDLPNDPVWSHLLAGAEVGLLAIELDSRRRLRINGVVSGIDDRRVGVSVREAYPNCPRYIQRRRVREDPGAGPVDRQARASGSASMMRSFVAGPGTVDPQARASGSALDDVRSRMVGRAATLFVASRHPSRGLDVSHRGGAPGFVRVLDARHLRIPDYPGNSMFNTLGNFMVDDHAGLVFPDFERGRVLQLTGTAAVRFDEEEDPRQPTGGAGRYWDFHVAHWLDRPVETRLAWELLDASPYNPIAVG